MEFAVSREGTTLVTLHEGTDTTARGAATENLAERLEALASEGAVSAWTVADAEVYEPPTGPFDPYTITVGFSVTVAVEADDAESAKAAGERAIDAALEDAGMESVSFSAEAAASTA